MDNAKLDYLWLVLCEPTLKTIQDVISSKAENGYVSSLDFCQSILRGAVLRFLRAKLDYYREDSLPDLYVKEVWPVFSELHRIVRECPDVGSPTLNADPRAYLFLLKVFERRHDLLEALSAKAEKFRTYACEFREREGEAMYAVRRRTDFLATACGRVFGFFPYSRRAENICFNDGKDYSKGLKWLRNYIVWLRLHNDNRGAENFLEELIVPNAKRVCVCGFLGMSHIDDDFSGDYYGEFSYSPHWDRESLRGTRYVNRWFRLHLNDFERKGLLYTTETHKRSKDIAIFWPCFADAESAWPESKTLGLAGDALNCLLDRISPSEAIGGLSAKERIIVLEQVLCMEEKIPELYYHLANNYREIGEEEIAFDIIRLAWCSRTLRNYADGGFFEMLEDEYYDALAEYLESY